MCTNKQAVQARYDAAVGLKNLSRFGRLDTGLKEAYNGILAEAIPRSMQELVSALERK